jgi:hypothetical protein
VLHKFFLSVYVHVCISVLSLLGNGSVTCIPHNDARQRLLKHVTATTNMRYNNRIVGRIFFFVIHVLSKESLCVCLCIALQFLGKKSVKTFQRQRRIVGGDVFCEFHVVLKESRRIVLPRTSCVNMVMNFRTP